MKKALNVTKYQLMDTVRAGAVFYGVILAVLLVATIPMRLLPVEQRGTMNGIEFATTIFLFVAGLNSFKSPFRFSLTNGVTRRDYYLGTALALVALAAVFTLIDLVVYAVFHGIGTLSSSAFQSIYTGYGDWAQLIRVAWNIVLNLLALTGGWLITAAFYRANKGGKIALALSPVALQVVLALAIRWLPGTRNLLVILFETVTGTYGNTLHAGNAVVSMAVGSVLCFILTWLLTRRAAVK